MLKEYHRVIQHAGESFRRLFWDDYLQLYVWFDTQQQIVGFELSYDVADDCRAIRWNQERGSTHYRVDDGDTRVMKKAAPVLQPDATRVEPKIAAEFRERSAQIDPDIAALVFSKLRHYLATLASSSANQGD